MEKDKLYSARHTAAHVMAKAIKDLYPETQFGIGPVINDGFYYDFILPEGATITDSDFSKIKKRMIEIKKKKYEIIHEEWTIEKALDYFSSNNQKYKVELIEDLRDKGTTSIKDIEDEGVEFSSKDTVSVYIIDDFIDLCSGPHVASTAEMAEFKLTRIAGAYWRGDSDNDQLQRLYSLGYENREELLNRQKELDEAKLNDHRILGEKLELFLFAESVGSGLPLILPRGEKVKDLLIRYMRQLEEQDGYSYVSSPVLTDNSLYERSGHVDFYSEDMYGTESDEEGNRFFIKPMNCPHHHVMFEKLVTSYRDMPLRLAEAGTVYRYELSGALSGLTRVRGPITQNDAHIYIQNKDVTKEFVKVINLFKIVYAEFNITGYRFRLSLPDFNKDKFDGSKKDWEQAADAIRAAFKQTNVEYYEELGEAAFYGPKMDVQIDNIHGKEDTIATSQVDILVPERMNLTFINSEGEKEFPLIIHRAIMGSYERFMAYIIEKFKGRFPLWLAPEQVRILTVNDETSEYTSKLASVLDNQYLEQPLKANKLRYSVNDSSDSLSKKIKESEKLRIPIVLIVGPKDYSEDTVALRYRQGQKQMDVTIKAEDLVSKIMEVISNEKY